MVCPSTPSLPATPSHTAALRGSSSILDSHAGSPLLLLLLLLVAGPALNLALYALYGRLVMAWSAAALPLLATLSLGSSGAMCRRLLEVPGMEAPLASLHAALATAQ